MYSTENVADGKWHHAAVTYDGDNLTLFLDGEVALANGIPQVVNNASHKFVGSMDEIALYSIALSPFEIYDLVTCQSNWYDVVQYHSVAIDGDSPAVSLNQTDNYIAGGQVLGVEAEDATTDVTQVWYRIGITGDWTAVSPTPTVAPKSDSDGRTGGLSDATFGTESSGRLGIVAIIVIVIFMAAAGIISRQKSQ